MNTLVIPPSTNWYETNTLACAPDNTVLYGSRTEIVVIKPSEDAKPADVKIISRAHLERVTSIAVAPTWGESDKLAVSVGEDKVVRLWDMGQYSVKLVHSGHTTNTDRVIGATFAGNDRIVSVSEYGLVIVWRYASNELIPLKDLFGAKAKVTALSSCPHAGWLTAFGLKNGLIVIADLRRSGRIMYRLRGHDKSIVALSWCPTPYSVFKEKENHRAIKKSENTATRNFIRNILEEITESIVNDAENSQKPVSIVTTSQNLIIENQNGAEASQSLPKSTKTKPNPWINLKHVDDDEIPANYAEHTSQNREVIKDHPDDFLKACATLRQQIIESKEESTEHSTSGEQIASDVSYTEASTEESHEHQKESVVDEYVELERKRGENKPVKHFLLASSARGGSICIWRAGSDGRLQTELRLPGRSSSHKNRKSSDKLWISLLWVKPSILLSSSQYGELLEWDLEKIKTREQNLKPRLIHNDHSGTLFCIAAPMTFSYNPDDINWRNSCDVKVWTAGQDRYLLNTSLSASREVLMSYPTIGSVISCFVASSLDPNRIAIGLADGTARVWDLSRPHLQYITMTNLWQKMQSKILTLAWHPTNEALLAYGTLEGRIGIVDTTNTSKPPHLLTQYFRSGVYHVEWGPLKEDTGLYACAEGRLVTYDTNKPLEDPVALDIPKSDHVTQFAWKSDYSVLAVGTKTGSIGFYDKDAKLLQTFYVQQKSVQCLVWHPEAASESKEASPYAGWLACGTNDSAFVVYDCHSLGDEAEVKVVAKLSGHASAIRDLAWSPFEGNKLVSASEDGVAQVWDVVSKSVIATFVGHNLECVTSVLWSPLDPDLIITGAKDNTIRIWRVSENPPLAEVDNAALRKVQKKAQKIAEKAVASPAATSEAEIATKPKKVSRDAMFPATSKVSNDDSSAFIDDCRRLFELQCGEKKERGQGDADGVDALCLFQGRDELLKLLEYEQEGHVKRGKNHCAHHMSLWKGNIAEAVKSAIADGSVTPWLISVAPMVSPILWHQACEIYAAKLSESPNSDPIETASYYLACHKVEEAIAALCNGSLYREALALAKCRLGEEDPLIREVTQRWATYCTHTGNFEVAAQCYIALGLFEEAAKVLFRRSDSKTLKLAVDLAEKTGNKDLYQAVDLRYKLFKFEEDKAKEPIPLPTLEDVLLAQSVTSNSSEADSKTSAE